MRYGSLTELANIPGELAGYGPIIAEMARQIALEEVAGKWTFTITDDGTVVSTGTLSRRPTAAQRRQAYADYPTCVFPGCRMAAYDCDLDHRQPHAEGGPTHNDNLEPLCRHHHMTRHNTPWRLTRDSDGHHTWISPLGHRYLIKRGPPI
jgi:hypothetical protein